jgi:pantoate--beta-alanine ligase
MYPDGPRSHIEVAVLSEEFEGNSRPGHFRGVATIVGKLLHAVQPHVLTLGQKDAQQAAVLRRMVEDLFFDVEVLVAPIVRADDGVALSSRLRYLDPAQREAARATARAVETAREALLSAGGDPAPVLAAARAVIEAEPLLKVDYLELVDPTTLSPIDKVAEEALLLLAVFCGKATLTEETEK